MTERHPDTPITREQWENAQPQKQGLRDSRGRVWKIVQNIGKVEIGHRLLVRCPGHESEYMTMSGVFQGRHIIDEEIAIMLELNEEGAAIIDL